MLEQRLKPGEQQCRDLPTWHHLRDHPEPQQVQELWVEETLQALTIADGSFSPTEVIREDKKLTLPTHQDLVQQEEQLDNRFVECSKNL